MKRQKHFLLCVLLLLMYHTFQGQDHPDFIGVKGGINLSNLTGNNSKAYPYNSDFSNKKGTYFGIFIETRLKTWLSCQALGIELSSQGAKKEGLQAFLTTVKYAAYFQPGQVPKYLYAKFQKDIKLNYVMLSSLIKFSTNSDKKFNAYSSIGYFTAYLLSAKEINSGSGVIYKDDQQLQPLSSTRESFNETKNIKPGLHKFNVGLSVNVGLSFNTGKTKIFIESGENYGVININKKTENGTTHIKALFGRIGFCYNVGEVLPIKFR